MKKLKKFGAALVGLLALPAVALAALPLPPPVGLPGRSTDNVTDLLVSVIENILLPIAAILAVLFLIIGGYRYIISAGNEEQAEAAKKTIQNAIIGLVVIILSYTIITVIANSLT